VERSIGGLSRAIARVVRGQGVANQRNHIKSPFNMIPKSAEPLHWEKIVDEIEQSGGTLRWGRASLRGFTLWRVEVEKGDGHTFIAQAEDLPLAFAELHRMLTEAADPASENSHRGF
jgi:hypothetical protein